jgi:hypothetical protein
VVVALVASRWWSKTLAGARWWLRCREVCVREEIGAVGEDMNYER